MKEKTDRALETAIVLTLILFCIGTILFLIAFKEMMNDHRCYNLPLNEFYQDKKCEKYWNLREWKNK